MILRDLRRNDGPSFFDLMEKGFPEENALLGNRPEEFKKVFRRIFRWDSRFLLGLFRVFGRPIVRALVIEADGRVVATTLVTFPPGAAYVSNVVVDAAYRRRGFAKRMLDEALREAKRAHRAYIALDVLEQNTKARTLYESVGYRPIRARSHFVHLTAPTFGTQAPAHSAIRPFRRTDASALVELVRRQTPPEVERVLPTEERAFVGSRLMTRMLASEEASWVIDRGSGPEGHVGAAVATAMEAAHMTAPVIGDSVGPDLAAALVRTAGTWIAARKSPRILSMVADDNARGRAALEGAGFRRDIALWTLYRPVG